MQKPRCQGFDPWQSMAKFPNFRLCMEIFSSLRCLQADLWTGDSQMVSLGQQGATPSSFDTPIASTTTRWDLLSSVLIQLKLWIGEKSSWSNGLELGKHKTTKLAEKFWVSTAYASQPSEALSVIGRNCNGDWVTPTAQSEFRTTLFRAEKTPVPPNETDIWVMSLLTLFINSSNSWDNFEPLPWPSYLIAKGADRTGNVGCT